MGIKFLTELSKRSDYDPYIALACNISCDCLIFKLETLSKKVPSGNYWTNWGGIYSDIPTNSNIQVFFEQFLQRVPNLEALKVTPNSIYNDADNHYINLTKLAYNFFRNKTELTTSIGFLSAPIDENDPSNIVLDGQKYKVRMSVPKLSNALSSPINGQEFSKPFSIQISNNDGAFDKTEDTNFFNTPIVIKKTSVDNPTYEDFVTIKRGIVDNVTVDFDKMVVSATDIYRSLSQEVCKVFNSDDYPNAPSDTLGKSIPVGYGSLKSVELFNVGTTNYIAIDKDYIQNVTAVRDEDGTNLSFTFDSTTGIINVPSGEPKTCDCVGKINNKIGEIIVDEVSIKGAIPFIEGIWDVAEVNNYISICGSLNFYFKGGKVKTLVSQVLKSDNAFFIEKNDGLITLRQWGSVYDQHYIPNWGFTKKPTKKTDEAKKYYSSTVRINYNKNQSQSRYLNSYIDSDREAELIEQFRKSNFVTLNTDLDNESDAISLSNRYLDRFGGYKETITLGTAYDTSMINLLDTVRLDIVINGRQLSEYSGWIVKGIDPAQDTLTLEALSYRYYKVEPTGHRKMTPDGKVKVVLSTTKLTRGTIFYKYDKITPDNKLKVTPNDKKKILYDNRAI